MPNWKNRPFRPTVTLPGRSNRSPGEDAPERILQPRREDQVPVEASVVEKALYCDGRRVEAPHSLREAMHRLHQPDRAMAWIGLVQMVQRASALRNRVGFTRAIIRDPTRREDRRCIERTGDSGRCSRNRLSCR